MGGSGCLGTSQAKCGKKEKKKEIITQLEDVDPPEGCVGAGRGMWETSVPSSQFCFVPEIALKCVFIFDIIDERSPSYYVYYSIAIELETLNGEGRGVCVYVCLCVCMLGHLIKQS